MNDFFWRKQGLVTAHAHFMSHLSTYSGRMRFHQLSNHQDVIVPEQLISKFVSRTIIGSTMLIACEPLQLEWFQRGIQYSFKHLQTDL